MNKVEHNNIIGTTLHIEYRSIQTKVSSVTHRRCNTPSVPNGVGARGRAFGLRNSEIAFPRTIHIGNVTCVAIPSWQQGKLTHLAQQTKYSKKFEFYG